MGRRDFKEDRRYYTAHVQGQNIYYISQDNIGSGLLKVKVSVLLVFLTLFSIKHSLLILFM